MGITTIVKILYKENDIIEYLKLKCPVCGFIPNYEDLKKTDYHLSKCSICGGLACDLCNSIDAKAVKEHKDDWINYLICDKCRGDEPIGIQRRFYLANEYKGD